MPAVLHRGIRPGAITRAGIPQRPGRVIHRPTPGRRRPTGRVTTLPTHAAARQQNHQHNAPAIHSPGAALPIAPVQHRRDPAAPTGQHRAVHRAVTGRPPAVHRAATGRPPAAHRAATGHPVHPDLPAP
jgi:hypothetical protein